MARPGERYPALPHDAPAATPRRSTTVTSTPCSCRNQAVESPTTPAPITTAVRGPAMSMNLSPLCRCFMFSSFPPAARKGSVKVAQVPGKGLSGRNNRRSSLVHRQGDDHREPLLGAVQLEVGDLGHPPQPVPHRVRVD